MNFKTIIYFISLYLLSIIAFSQETIILSDLNNEYVVKDKNVLVFEDSTNSFRIDEISRNKSLFKPIKDPYAYNVNEKSTYWVKLKIKNNSSFDNDYLLETYSPISNDFRIYIQNPQGKFIEKKAGSSFPFKIREHQNKNVIFTLPVDNDSNKIQTIYIRIKSIYYSSFDFRIKTQKFFMHYSTNEYLFLGIYYGILIIMAVYNLVLFFTIKEKMYLFYVVYVLAGILTTATDDGLGFQFIWPNMPEINGFIINIFVPHFLLIAFILYSISFLHLNHDYKKYRKYLIYIAAGYILYYTIVLLFIPSLMYFKGFYIIPYITIYIIAILTYREGYKAAKFFIIAYTFVFLSIILIQLRGMNLVPGTIFTVYALNYGLVIEVVLLSFAQAERFRMIKKEKEIAQGRIIESLEENKLLQEKVNRELEQKVTERTLELKDKNEELINANGQLQELNKKINEMNAKLDYDNWHLKKDLQEGLKARITDTEVTKEKFTEIFPDDHACYKYLEEQKWGKGFKCRKCANTKYTKGPKPHTRKCTKCSSIESATAYTLFHGVRFPIDKAFYMTYIIHRKGNKITLDELSEMMDLRRNTCWSFKKKVMAQIEEFKNNSKDGHLETWEEIIL